MKKRMLAIVLCLMMVLSLSACGAAAKDMVMENTGGAMYAPESAVGEFDYFYAADSDSVVSDSLTESGKIPETDAPAEAPSLPANRKLIQTVNMSVETENLDEVLRKIDARIAELGGYMEASNVRNGSIYSSGRRYRSADLTIRIPADKLSQFTDTVGEVSNVVSSNKTVDDITLSYVATESRMKALETEQERLLELLSKAETLKDLLTVESRLTEVRTELEQITSTLRVMDNQVSYSTVELHISEVTEYTPVEEPETVWERIGTGFVKSLKGVGNFFEELFVFLIVGSPYFVLVAILIGLPALVVLLIIKSIRRKNRKRREQNSK